MISEAVTTKISKSTFSHPCSKFLATAKVAMAHYHSFRGGGSPLDCSNEMYLGFVVFCFCCLFLGGEEGGSVWVLVCLLFFLFCGFFSEWSLMLLA